MTESSTSETLTVPFSRVSSFIRQVTHDVRNNLNSIDLQAAYLAELVTDAETLAEVRRIRALIQTSARHLQALSANFQAPSPNMVAYTARILIEDLRDRLTKIFPETATDVTWTVDLA